ncbi:electron transfer flavoprotein subunit alpha/FixB family protein [Nesterenkonia alba]|uniref:electron transfer flavoprotein subunit alpha/FixB family protein n=1 Tax=Nesterenkonia alba TaxID=515814 RepID=UPI0003B3EA24|nr:electron transfer flavoprotein subunit alpha/FixB family protein [Nesterenkonia alba]
MTNVLVFFDRLDEELSGAQRELLSLAGRIGAVHVVTGADPQVVPQPLSVKGIHDIYTGTGLIEPPDAALADLLETALAESHADVVLGADTPDAVDALARLAVRAETGLITSATDISPDLVVTKQVLAGAYTTTSQVTGEGPLIVTLKPNSVESVVVPGHPQEVTSLPVGPSQQTEVLASEQLPSTGRPPLTEARVVVAAGRGIDGDLSLIEELADELGAAIGASRAATDAGWIDHSAQVGQTGVTVSPQLYISVGISGAIQQKAGMQTSGTIVAINKDEDAPVFEIADFGVVGDLNEVLPQMIEEIRRRRS